MKPGDIKVKEEGQREKKKPRGLMQWILRFKKKKKALMDCLQPPPSPPTLPFFSSFYSN